MKSTRVLIVDDSIVVRQTLATVVDADDDLQVVGMAATGRTAVEQARLVEPDVMILDLEMPGLDGLEVLRTVRREHPQMPVIMFSTPTERSAAATLEALSAGATDFVLKPACSESLPAAMDRVQTQLIGKIREVFGHGQVPTTSSNSPAPAIPLEVPATRPVEPRAKPPVRRRTGISGARVDLVAIGCSTGGPNALASLLPALPESFPVPIVIVQHMPPLFTETLAKRLNASCALSVAEARRGLPIRTGEIWLAPGSQHVTVQPEDDELVLGLDRSAPINSCRPSVDRLFDSVATTVGCNCLAVVLTGMGQDGAAGAKSIQDAGGQVIVQDAASSVVWGMPGSVANAGLADQVLPLEALAAEIESLVSRGR